MRGYVQPAGYPEFPDEQIKIKNGGVEAFPGQHPPTASEINWVTKGMVTPVQS